MRSGGIKQRIARSDECGGGRRSASSAPGRTSRGESFSAPGPRRGIKRQVNDADAAISSSAPAAQNMQDGETPLNDALVKYWVRGKLTSEMVEELAFKSAKQGATNLGKLGNTRTPQNACRGLVRALPKGSSAPDIDFIEVPGPDGKTRPHPILCPIKTLEIVITHFNIVLFYNIFYPIFQDRGNFSALLLIRYHI